jgi:hypothetical protein
MNKTRKKGLILLISGVTVTAVMIGFANLMMGEGNWTFIGYGFSIPGAMALVGLMQLVGGVPFGELSHMWDMLAGWQRGILGVLFVAVACAIIFGCIFLFVTIAYE